MGKQSANQNLPAVAASEISFAIAAIGKGEISTILSENMGTDEISARDLPQIKVPSGGVTTFTIPDVDGEIESKEIIGIIVATKLVRAYWKESFDDTGGGTPPDCISEDGERGIGDPGVECAKCPYAEFGSAAKGRGKACSEKRLLFVAVPDQLLPIVFRAPPTSLKNVKSYLMGLTSRGKKLYDVLTAITLERDKSKDGIQYSKIVLRKVGDVQDKALWKAYAESIKPYLLKAARELASERDPLDNVQEQA